MIIRKKYPLGIFLFATVMVMPFLALLFSSGVWGASSSDFVLTEDSFSVTENTESTSSIMSETVLLPVQLVGEGGGTVVERSHELSVCGNNVQEFQEACDGIDVLGRLCSDYGYNSGTVTCSTDCSAFVTSGCFTTVDPTPTPTPMLVISRPTTVSSTGNNNGGGRNPLLLVTPVPTEVEAPLHSSAPIATPEEPETVSDPTPTPTVFLSPTLPPVVPVTPSTFEIMRTPDPEVLTVVSEVSEKNTISENVYLGDISSSESFEEPKAYPDTTPDLSDVEWSQFPVASLVYDEEMSNYENNRVDELFHSSAGNLGAGNNTTYTLSAVPCTWVVLLIVFLLGMLTEYILSSVLLFRRK